MAKISGREIREKFINYFKSKDHVHDGSSSLIPYNDDSLLFTNAGMVQYKNVFLGLEKKPYTRAVTAQRCVRAGGKHNDLDTVGRTARHHTFFEMLGNFSFGDYFKKDAISYAWEFITQELALDTDKLYITVFEKDDDAAALWQEITGLSPERILRIGEKDNFWSMGDTGPCGPCSEIFYDRGEKYTCDAPECGIGKCDCDRYMEIWNLVFMEYNRDEQGVLTPLPNPSIDTGMGLERVASILQGVDSNYETDLFVPLIKAIESISGKTYTAGAAGFPFRVIADHSRSCSFLIADGVMPSNEGRGYVLRRILRRAVRFGKSLGLNQPFLYKMVEPVADSLGNAYPELVKAQDSVAKVIKIEEERFFATLQEGLTIAGEIMAKTKAAGKIEISGQDAFVLYDTYGFPLDLTKDIGEENGLTVDEGGFYQSMEHQRDLAKKAGKEKAGGSELPALARLLAEYPSSLFKGYESLEAEALVQVIVVDGDVVERAASGQRGWLVLDETVFYPEGGGQAGDRGIICSDSGKMEIGDTQKLPNGVVVHKFRVLNGEINCQKRVSLAVDFEERQAIAANHSATHLLQGALRNILGAHVRQSGSAVDKDRLRFDFSHFAPLTAGELETVEAEINRQVLKNLPITCQEMPMAEAEKIGAMAFFGDKYGDIVRVVKMGDYSTELCGGTHCKATGEIGFVKLLTETGIAAGMRRIEMLTALNSLAFFKEQEELVQNIAALLKTQPQDAFNRVERLSSELKEKNRELEKLKNQLAQGSLDDTAAQIKDLGGIRVLAAQLKNVDDISAVREALDTLRQKYAVDACILGAKAGDKAVFAASCNAAAQEKGYHAGQLVKGVAAVCDGSGGGKADMAQAGGKDVTKLDEAIATAWSILMKV